MFAIPIFFLTWLGGGVATGSISAGFHTAAVVYLWWSICWTVIWFVGAIFDEIKFAYLLFWNGLGLAAAFCLTLGGTEFIVVGIIFWIISVIVESLMIEHARHS